MGILVVEENFLRVCGGILRLPRLSPCWGKRRGRYNIYFCIYLCLRCGGRWSDVLLVDVACVSEYNVVLLFPPS